MPHFYRSSQLRITHRRLEIWHPVHRVYAIRDLGPIWKVERRGTPAPRALRPAAFTSLLAAAAAEVARELDAGSAVPLAFEAGLAVGALALTGTHHALRRRRRAYELWAYYGGARTRLLSCADPTRFGQITRALRRAVEWHRDLDDRDTE